MDISFLVKNHGLMFLAWQVEGSPTLEKNLSSRASRLLGLLLNAGCPRPPPIFTATLDNQNDRCLYPQLLPTTFVAAKAQPSPCFSDQILPNSPKRSAETVSF